MDACSHTHTHTSCHVCLHMPTSPQYQKLSEWINHPSERAVGWGGLMSSRITVVTKHDRYLWAEPQSLHTIQFCFFMHHWLILKVNPHFLCVCVVCFLSGSENGRCVASEYFTEPDIEITTENTANILSESQRINNTLSAVRELRESLQSPLLIDRGYWNLNGIIQQYSQLSPQKWICSYFHHLGSFRYLNKSLFVASQV